MKMPLVRDFTVNRLAIGLMVTFFSLTTVAQERNIESPTVMEVKYLEGDNDALVFNVRYDNKSGNTFRLLAVDETGETCFQNNYSEKDFEKRIKIPRLTDTDYVIFLISSSKQNIQHCYKVKVTTKVVDEMVFVKNRELVSYK